MSEPPSDYPPEQHLLRDLRIATERNAGDTVATIDVVPEMHDATGSVRMGVLATLVDCVGGEAAIRAVFPGWVATSDLTLHLNEPQAEGTIEARPTLLRKGRQSAIIEVGLRHRQSGEDFGLGTLGFSILPARSDFQKSGDWTEEPQGRSDFALPESRLRKDVLDAIGLRFDAADPATARIDKSDYVINSLGAIQGGAVAMTLEAAGAHFASEMLERPVRTTGFTVHYLALAKVGPARAQCRDISRNSRGMVVRVELRDEGQDDRLATVATIQVDVGGANSPA